MARSGRGEQSSARIAVFFREPARMRPKTFPCHQNASPAPHNTYRALVCFIITTLFVFRFLPRPATPGADASAHKNVRSVAPNAPAGYGAHSYNSTHPKAAPKSDCLCFSPSRQDAGSLHRNNHRRFCERRGCRDCKRTSVRIKSAGTQRSRARRRFARRAPEVGGFCRGKTFSEEGMKYTDWLIKWLEDYVRPSVKVIALYFFLFIWFLATI